MTMTARAVAAETSLSESQRTWHVVMAAVGVGLLLVLYAQRATFGEMISTWQRQGSYQYAWAVVPTLVYLLWHNRRRFAGLKPQASIMGVLAAALSALVWVVSDLGNIAVGREFAVVVGIGAIVWAAVGWQVIRKLSPYFALLLMLVPSGDVLLTPLKYITLGFVKLFAIVTGLPFSTQGMKVFLGSHRYVIIDDCAGLPFFLIGVFLGLSLALMIYQSPWRIAAFTLLGGGLAILANGMRVIGIVAYDALTGTQMELSAHSYFEWPSLIVGFALLFLVFNRLRPEPLAADVSQSRWKRSGQARAIVLAVLAAVACVSFAPVFVAQALPRTGIPAAALALPNSLAGWKRLSDTLDWSPSLGNPAVTTAMATYGVGNEKIAIFIAQTDSPQGKLSAGALDMAGSRDWMPSYGVQRLVCGGSGCLPLWHQKFIRGDSKRVRHVYTLFSIDEHRTTSAMELRLRRAWSLMTGGDGQTELLAVSIDRIDGLSDVALVTLFSSILRGQAPEL